MILLYMIQIYIIYIVYTNDWTNECRYCSHNNEAPAVLVPPGLVFVSASGLHRGRCRRTFNFITLVLLILTGRSFASRRVITVVYKDTRRASSRYATDDYLIIKFILLPGDQSPPAKDIVCFYYFTIALTASSPSTATTTTP